MYCLLHAHAAAACSGSTLLSPNAPSIDACQELWFKRPACAGGALPAPAASAVTRPTRVDAAAHGADAGAGSVGIARADVKGDSGNSTQGQQSVSCEVLAEQLHSTVCNGR
jgi:hypothetical protein